VLRFLAVTLSILFLFARSAVRFLYHGRCDFIIELELGCGPLCARLGGAFPKVGQILGTRADLLPARICATLARLQDDMPPLPAEVSVLIIDRMRTAGKLTAIQGKPVASATVAQVHQATLSGDGRQVALKLLRPGVAKTLREDCRIMRFIGRWVAGFPQVASIPVNEALEEISLMLVEQTRFGKEARKHQRLERVFAGSHGVIVPKLHAELCSDEILVMDFIPGMQKLTDPAVPDGMARDALTIGLRALYRMVFDAGFIHCDLHPGNMLLAPDGRLVILDAGFMVEIDDATRLAFGEFFLAIAFKDGRTAARIVRETAARLPRNLQVERFDRDICALIERMGGLRARDFQVAAFVGELFSIQRQHGIYGTSQFTMIILALLVFEGVAKQRYPDLDFQQEAVPYVIQALAKRSA
jgi:ubiquinone biosynthesis protein